MNRTVALAFLVVWAGIDATAQHSVGAAPVQGIKIVNMSELRARPDVPPEEAARLLAPRQKSAPPDGIVRSTIYVKGSAVRIEYAASPEGQFEVSPAGDSTVYVVSEGARTYWTYSLRDLDNLGGRWQVTCTSTGGVESIATLQAEEVLISGRYLTPRAVLGPPRPSSNRYDGYTSPESDPDPRRNMTMDLAATDLGIEGRAWLITLPGGADARKLGAMSSGYRRLVPASGGRYPARLVTSTTGLRSTPKVDLHETIESIETIPLDDQLFQRPKGFRKIPMPKPASSPGRIQSPPSEVRSRPTARTSTPPSP